MNITAIVSVLTKEQLLALLSGADETSLRAAAAAALTAPAQPAEAPAAAPKAPKAASAPAAAPKAAKAPKAAPVAAGADPVRDAIRALASTGQGFSMGELAEATGLDSKSSGLRTGVKNALAAKDIASYGEKRFTRYGKTEAIAKKRSEADRTAK